MTWSAQATSDGWHVAAGQRLWSMRRPSRSVVVAHVGDGGVVVAKPLGSPGLADRFGVPLLAEWATTREAARVLGKDWRTRR